MQFKDKPKRRVIINITSLIDVLFLLLIFFMVTSTFLEQPGIKLELPSAKSASAERVEDLVLFLGAGGEIVFEDRAVPADSLETVMREAVSRSGERTLVLKADRAVPHGDVVRVMGMARSAGLMTLVVGTKVEED